MAVKQQSINPPSAGADEEKLRSCSQQKVPVTWRSQYGKYHLPVGEEANIGVQLERLLDAVKVISTAVGHEAMNCAPYCDSLPS